MRVVLLFSLMFWVFRLVQGPHNRFHKQNRRNSCGGLRRRLASRWALPFFASKSDYKISRSFRGLCTHFLRPGLHNRRFVLHLCVMRAFVLLPFLIAACSGATAPGTSEADGGTCNYPASVVVDTNPSGSGCFASPPGQICQVSNGATINLTDGGATEGTQSCSSLCGRSRYEMTCRGTAPIGTIPSIDPSLDCQVIPIPTPSNTLFYCCPCVT